MTTPDGKKPIGRPRRKPKVPTVAEILEAQRSADQKLIIQNSPEASSCDPAATVPDDSEMFVLPEINNSLEWSGGGPGWVPREAEYKMYVDYAMGRNPLAIMFDRVRNPRRYSFQQIRRIVNCVHEFCRRQVLRFSDITPDERYLTSLSISASVAYEAFEKSRQDSVETITSPDGKVTTKRSGQVGNAGWLTTATDYTEKIREVAEKNRSGSANNGGLIPSSLGKTQVQVQIEFLKNATRLLEQRQRDLVAGNGNGDGDNSDSEAETEVKEQS